MQQDRLMLMGMPDVLFPIRNCTDTRHALMLDTVTEVPSTVTEYGVVCKPCFDRHGFTHSKRY